MRGDTTAETRNRLAYHMLRRRGLVPGSVEAGPGEFRLGNESPIGIPGIVGTPEVPTIDIGAPGPAPGTEPGPAPPTGRPTIENQPTGRPTIEDQPVGPAPNIELPYPAPLPPYNIPTTPVVPVETRAIEPMDPARDFNPFFDPRGDTPIGLRGYTRDALGLHPSDRGFEDTGPQDRTLQYPTPLPPPNPWDLERSFQRDDEEQRQRDEEEQRREDQLREEQLQELGPSRSEQQLHDEQLQELGPSPGKSQDRYTGPPQIPTPYTPDWMPDITDDPNAPENQEPLSVPGPSRDPEEVTDNTNAPGPDTEPSADTGARFMDIYAPSFFPETTHYDQTSNLNANFPQPEPDWTDIGQPTEDTAPPAEPPDSGKDQSRFDTPDLNQTFSNFTPIGENKAGEVVFSTVPQAEFSPSTAKDEDPNQRDQTDAEQAAELADTQTPSLAELQAAGYLTTQQPDLQSIDINAARDAAEQPAPAVDQTSGSRGGIAAAAMEAAQNAAERTGEQQAEPAVPEDFGPLGPNESPYGPYGPTEAPTTAPTVPDYGPYGPGGQRADIENDQQEAKDQEAKDQQVADLPGYVGFDPSSYASPFSELEPDQAEAALSQAAAVPDYGIGAPTGAAFAETAGPMGGLADLGGAPGAASFGPEATDIVDATLASFAPDTIGMTGFDDVGAAPGGFDDVGGAPGGFDDVGGAPGGFDDAGGAPGDGFDAADGADAAGGFDDADGADGGGGGDFGDGDDGGDDGGGDDGGDDGGGDDGGGDGGGGDGGGGDGGGGDGGGDGGGGDGGDGGDD